MVKKKLLIFCLITPFFLMAQWISNPLVNNQICVAADNQMYPKIIPDNKGGGIIVWEDYRTNFSGTGWDIYIQRISATGVVKWTVNGVGICLANNAQNAPVLVSDGASGAILAWEDNRLGNNYNIYAQRIDSSGIVQWTIDGVPVCSANADQRQPTIVSDDLGGAIIAWNDLRNGVNNNDIYAQYINSSGAPQWTLNGVPICTAAGSQTYPSIINDGSTNTIITWDDKRGGNKDIYAQKLDALGVPQWTLDGVAINTAAYDQMMPKIVTDGSNGAIISWQTMIGILGVYAQRVSPSGTLLWTSSGVPIFADPLTTGANSPRIVADGFGGAIVVNSERRNGVDQDVYAQKIDASGSVVWTTNGVTVGGGAGNQQFPEIVSDNSGGAIISWEDTRLGNSNVDIYIQEISSSGVIQYSVSGLAVSTVTNNQGGPQLISDYAGGSIVVWYDNRNGSNSDIYIDRIPLSIATGIGAYNKNEVFNIFPNPSSGNFKVELNSFSDEALIFITNSLGQIVYESTVADFLDGGENIDLVKGIYFITIQDKSISNASKLIID